MSNKNLKQTKLTLILLFISISIISFNQSAFAESQKHIDSSIFQIQTQCQNKDNDGSKRGRPKRRKPMGNRLYSVTINCRK